MENLLPKPRLARHLHDFSREEQEHEEHVRVPDQTARPSSLDRLGGSPLHLMMHARFWHLLFVVYLED